MEQPRSCLDDRVVPLKKELAIHDPLALPKESIFKNLTASHTSKSDTVNAIGDRVEPRWSSGNKTPRWTSRGQEGKPQTITGEFHGTKQIRSIGVYWMDHYQHPVKFPKEWKVETRKDGKWEPFQLYTTDRYDTRANQYNVIHPAAPSPVMQFAFMLPHERICRWYSRGTGSI